MSQIYRMGMQVLASDGRAGTVEDVLYDTDGIPRYLVVRDRGVFAEDVVLPVGGATVDGDDVRYSLTKDQIHQSDRYNEAEHGARAGLSSGAAGRYDAQDGDR